MGVSERRAREKEELRQKILNAATELFVQEGFGNVSMRKIADKIEYSPTTIYLYFKDKAELIGNICAEVFGGLNRGLDEIVARNLPHLERLRVSLRYFIDFGLSHSNHYLVVFCLPQPTDFAGAMPKDPETNPGMVAFGKLRKCIGLCMGAGVIRQGDVEVVSQCTLLMMHGVTSALITMRSFPWVDRDTLIDASVERIIRGLGAEQ
jgi:AcrR family transcriptional regulator